MKKKILVTFVEAGNGHIVAAQAIADYLEKANDGSFEVLTKDIFHCDNKLLQNYEKFLIEETRKASTNGLHSRSQLFFMHTIGCQNTLKLVHSTVYKRQINAYVKELKKINPDVIVDTHYFTSYAAIQYRNKHNPKCKVITYNPDNNVHGWWCKDVDYFIVNNKLAKEQALQHKFLPEQVKQVFFVTRKGLSEANESKEFYRKKYNIPLNKFAVKIADGIYADAKMESFINELIKTKKPLTIVAIAGKNEEMLQKLKKMQVPKNITLLPFGFVEKIYELFKACDLFISKAGPNAVLDSVFMQTPVMINYWANQIEGTTKNLFIDQLGCGVTIKNKVQAREFVERCIDSPQILQPYIENEKKIDKSKNGAVEAARFIIEKLKEA